MSPFAIAVLAVSMSVDAFAVSVGRGAAIGRPRFSETLRTGITFGVVEALTPIIGWAAGIVASSFIEQVDHWIAFGLLVGVGLHMLIASLKHPSPEARPAQLTFPMLLATAVGTSLDAMAVGVSLAFLDVNIIVISFAIGLTTFLFSSGGMLLGRLIGERLGRIAESIAGIALILLGTSILFEHLSA